MTAEELQRREVLEKIRSRQELQNRLYRGVGINPTPDDIDHLLAHIDALEARVEKAEAEITLDDKIIADRNLVLEALPCPVHGQCVPHAIDEIAKLRAALEATKGREEKLRHALERIATGSLGHFAAETARRALAADGKVGE